MQQEPPIIDYAHGNYQGCNLNKRSLFDTIVRGFGLWELLNGGDEFISFINVHVGNWRPVSEEPNGVLYHVVWHVAVGLFLMFCANIVTNAVYGSDNPSASASADDAPRDKPAS